MLDDLLVFFLDHLLVDQNCILVVSCNRLLNDFNLSLSEVHQHFIVKLQLLRVLMPLACLIFLIILSVLDDIFVFFEVVFVVLEAVETFIIVRLQL